MSTSGQKRIESTIDTAIDCDEDEVMELVRKHVMQFFEIYRK